MKKIYVIFKYSYDWQLMCEQPLIAYDDYYTMRGEYFNSIKSDNLPPMEGQAKENGIPRSGIAWKEIELTS